jgi:hypothetical protein
VIEPWLCHQCLPYFPFLNHLTDRPAGGAIRANVFDHPDANCASIVLQKEGLPDFKFFLDLNKSAAKAMRSEAFWFIGT